MKKLLLLPLDNRPCNVIFPKMLFDNENYNLVYPKDIGNKKNPANFEIIKDFLINEINGASAVVLSIDMLLYGGLVPGRRHNLQKEELLKRLEIVKQFRKINKNIKIYAFSCIMRCPTYNSSDEEPFYYETHGANIHKLGVLLHKQTLSPNDESLKKQIDELNSILPKEHIEDYTNRRKLNASMNISVLDYVKNGDIDFLIIPQDDAAPYGFTALDQIKVRKKIAQNLLQDSVLIYPGADELAMTLLSRAINEIEGKTPLVNLLFASEQSKKIIPPFEDRQLVETLKYHILACKARLTSCTKNADLILAINAPSEDMVSFPMQHKPLKQYDIGRNMPWFINEIEHLCKEGKAVSIADNAYTNGAELSLLQILNKRKILFNLAGYAGWNTSSNTIGTALSQGLYFLHTKNTKSHKEFLCLRYIEDGGYCSLVRSDIIENHLQNLGLDNFDLKDKNKIISGIVLEKLNEFKKEYLSDISAQIEITNVKMPWNRMFEVQMDINLHSNC